MSIDFGQMILEHAPGGVIITDPDGKVLHWTKGAEVIFGYSCDEAAGRTIEELIGLAGKDDNGSGALQAFILGNADDREMLRRKKDGSPVYIEVSSKAIYDEQGRLAFIISTKKDITQLKAARDAKMIEARFREVLESTPDSIVVANSTGRIVLANTQAEKLFGYQQGELRGQLIEVLLPQRFHRAHVGHRWHYFGQPRTRTMGAGLELYGIRKDAVEFPVEISLSPIQTEAGPFVISAIRDVSGRKRIERILNEKTVELERANQAKDSFLTSMSHELRTPLNAILGFAQLLSDESLPSTAAQKKTFTQHILNAGEHLLALINEILDLAKIESGSMSLSLESVSLDEVIEEARVMVEPHAARRAVRLMVTKERTLNVLADRIRLKQIILNLFSNAVKYNREAGSVMVSCETMSGDRVRMSVQDTGAGLDSAQMAALFQPFNRLGQETGAEEGTGIGLVVTKRLTELMGGDIGVSSTLGEGSMFWVELPLAATCEPISRLPATQQARGGLAFGEAGATVLYVEDNPANLKLVEEIFQFRSDLRLISTMNAEQGIALARANLPQVILMDINLPGISGVEAQKTLRDDPKTAHIPVIALTANAMQHEVRKSIEAGFFRYLTKPIKIGALMEAIDSALAAVSATASREE